MKKTICLLTLSLFIITSCQSPSHTEMPDEASMEKLLQENPDSLANILEEKIKPGELSAQQKADYAWWLMKTHQRQGRSVMNDTLIHFSLTYYKNSDSPRLLETYLMAAEQSNWSQTFPQKEEDILNEALERVIKQENTENIQTICSSLLNLYEFPKDTDKIKKLIQIAKQQAESQWNASTYMNLTTFFSRLQQSDSVFIYARKGIELAQQQNSPLEFQLTRIYVESLNAKGQSNEALKALQILTERMSVGNEINFNYISTWINLGKLDSAQARINFFKPIINEYKSQGGVGIEISSVEALLGMFQSIIDIKKGKPLVLNSMGAAMNNIVSSGRNQIKIEHEQQYVQNKLIRDNLELDIERATLKQRFLWTGIIVSILIAIIIFIYQHKLLTKERSVQQAKEQLRIHTIQLSENESIIHKNEELINDLSTQLDESGELKEEINTLISENETLKQRNVTLQKDIENYSRSMNKKDQEVTAYEKLIEQNAKLREREHLLITRLIAQTDTLDKLSKKPRYIEKSQWPEIVFEINQLFDGFSYRLSSDFSSLSEEDIYYCCLLKLHLSTSVISALMGISPSSVTKRKQRIKEKMNQQRLNKVFKEQPLEIYLWNY